jgi:hypothetical protein
VEREIVAESRLDSVTVYASGALCRRTAVVGVVEVAEDGVRRVRVGGLPLAADAGSLRARAVTAGYRVTDVRREVRAEPRTPERLAELKQAVDAAEEACDTARGRRDRLAARVDATASLRAVPPAPRRGDPPRPAPVDAFLALAEFVDTRLAALHTRLLAAEDAVTRTSHELDLAQHRLAEASDALPTETTRTTADALVTLTGEASEGSTPERRTSQRRTSQRRTPEGGASRLEVELELEYVVPGATWFPSYQLRLSRSATVGADGGLALRASVGQRTGEDWTGARLSLSTADLLRRTSLPELRSIRLGRRQEEAAPAPLWREPPTGTAALFGGYDDVRPEPFAAKAAPVAVAATAPFRQETAVGGSAVEAWAGEERARGLGAPQRRRAAPRAAAGPRAVAYGGPPPPAPGAMPRAAGTMAAPPPQAALGGPVGPVAPGGAPPVAPAVPEPYPALQDYAGLVLAGPDAGPAARGRLAPEGADGQLPLEAEHRRRAASVGGLALPPHAIPVRHAPGSFAYRFDAAAPVDVPADGRWHSVPVEDFPVGLTPWHLCVPALDPAVYAAIELVNTSPHALLAGPADILVDGEYTATVAMPALAPGQSRRIGIGVEEGVRVARRVRTAESSSTGLRGATTVVVQTVEIEVANRLGRRISLEVLERVPVSDDKDVRIEDAAATPPWTVVAPEEDEQRRRGLRRWRVVVEAGDSATLTAGHQIRLPAGKAVVGGNRRDA